MRAEFAGEFGDEVGAFDGGGVDGDFVGAGADDGARIVERANAAACGERNGEFGGDATNGFEKRGAAVAGGRDVEDDEFVGAFGVVARGERDGIAGIAEADEVDAFDDASAVGVEAGNDAVGEAHAREPQEILQKLRAAAPLFSGWNWTAWIFVVFDYGGEFRAVGAGGDRCRRRCR